MNAPAMHKRFEKNKKLGELLVEANMISPEKLTECLRLQRQTEKKLGTILLEQDLVSSEKLVSVLGLQLGIPHIWLRKGLVDRDIVNVIPYEKAKSYQVLPLFKVRNILTLATSDPQDVFLFDELEKLTGCRIQPVLCRADDIRGGIEEYYSNDDGLSGLIPEVDEVDLELVERKVDADIQSLEELSEDSPIINLVNNILIKAVQDRASDIHLEPDRNQFRVRFRIDGVLYEAMKLGLELQPAVVSRLKIMAARDVAERRIPQDGRIQVRVIGKTVDLRFSSLPGIFGEKVVLRVLDKSNAILDIQKLGMGAAVLERMKKMLRRPHGLILTTGPTGSGKTTTLYGAICFLNSIEKNIVTIEDPVEYQLDIVNQNQVNESIGLTFPRILRHVLRQDPDIVMVGEIRDRETAEIAIQASLTGHLVLSTLHTNDACGAINRLLDMGIEPYLLASSVIGAIGQRLVRRICPECKTDYFPSAAVLQKLGCNAQENIKLSRGKGCSACYDSGFKGRLGLYEFLEVDQDIQRLINENATVEQLRSCAVGNGFRTIRQEGMSKVMEGDTCMEELDRAIMAGE